MGDNRRLVVADDPNRKFIVELVERDDRFIRFCCPLEERPFSTVIFARCSSNAWIPATSARSASSRRPDAMFAFASRSWN
jgi:hypothetical protein